MAREQFNIQHFLACHSMQWEGSPGLKTQKTLEGVGYYLQMPEGIEPPFSIEEIWLFTRIVRHGQGRFKNTFRVKLIRWTPAGESTVKIHPLGKVTVRNPAGVLDVIWAIRPCVFPLAGQYEFRLQALLDTDTGLKWFTARREFILVEEHR